MLSELGNDTRWGTGDTLVIWKLSRLGRSMKQLIETVHLLAETGIESNGLNESIDTFSATGKLLFHNYRRVRSVRARQHDRVDEGRLGSRRVEGQ